MRNQISRVPGKGSTVEAVSYTHLERQKHEAKYINEVVTEQASRTALIAWQIEPPVGPEALKHAMQADVVTSH